MLARTGFAWMLLLAVAIANGYVRESLLLPRTSRAVAHAVSTLTLSVLIIIVGSLATAWISPGTLQDAWIVGLVWLTLTLAFEFLAGHFVFGRTWSELFADYNLLAGRIWIMVLVVTLMTPIVAFVRGVR